MAKYPAVITTMAGTNTIAEANASKQALIFTKIVIGAGDMPASIPRATALTDKRLELAITKSVKTGDGQFMVQGLLSNKNLEAGFYAREIGLMAKAGDNGQEVLFSYTNGGNYVDYIPDKNTPMDSYTFTITTVIGNAEKVQAIVSDNGVASVHDLEAHNTDEHAHDYRFNAIIQQINNMITPTDDEDKQSLAPTLKLVKELQKGYLPITGGDLKGEITVNGKAAKTVVDSWYSDDKSQYWIKYSDGELVQMLTKDNPDSTGLTVVMINLFQPFIDTNYFVNAVYETHSKRRPNNNTTLSNSITAADNTVTESNFTPKSKNRFTIAVDSMSLCRVYCVGRWKL